MSSTLLNPEKFLDKSYFIVWNVGQGQWTTLVTEKSCDHFDIGGEINRTKEVLKICDHKNHRVHLSHWDWDHIGLLAALRRRVSTLCMWNRPLGRASLKKESLLEGLSPCEQSPAPYVQIYGGSHSIHASTNDTSQVILSHHILVPGDSTTQQEKIWARNPELKMVHGLILGHHGSKTSTSEALLAHLPNLKWSVATARKRRYGHPHPETLARLNKRHTPVLRTEDWGSLFFEL